MVQEMGFLLVKNKTKQQKLPRRGKTGQLAGLAGQDRAGQGRTGQGRAGQGRAGQGTTRQTFDNEPARDCKHKEIIKGANEEGNEKNTGGAN